MERSVSQVTKVLRKKSRLKHGGSFQRDFYTPGTGRESKLTSFRTPENHHNFEQRHLNRKISIGHGNIQEEKNSLES